MADSERLRAEAEAIQLIRTTPGLKVILSMLETPIGADEPKLDDPNWAIKTAYREGHRNAHSQLKARIEQRLRYAPSSPTEA